MSERDNGGPAFPPVHDSAPKWKPGRNFKWLYVAHDGRIIGEVYEAIGGGEWYAEAGNRDLGRYYAVARAKAAVEAAC